MSQGDKSGDDRDALARSIARRYLELWQDQVSALFTDPQNLAQASRMMNAGMKPATEQAWTLWRDFANLQANLPGLGPERHEQQRRGNGAAEGPGGTSGEAPSGAAPAAASPAGRDERLDELLARFQALEERIAALESGAAAKGDGAGSGKRGATRRGPAKRS